MTEEVKRYYDLVHIEKEGISGAGLIWYLGKDHLSPSYDNSDEIALNPAMWREGASKRVLNLVRNMKIKVGSRVLDFGSGIGGPGRDIQVATGCELYGINLSYNQIQSSRRLSRAINPANPLFENIINADGQQLPFRASVFDHVYSINTFYHIPNPEQAIDEIAYVLTHGGKFGLDDWFLTNVTSPETLEMLRHNWSSPQGFHCISNIREILETLGFTIIQEFDFTEEAANFLTENRFGLTFDNRVRQILIDVFPRLYKYEEYKPEHAEMAASQLKADIMYMGELYRDGQLVYKQLIAEK